MSGPIHLDVVIFGGGAAGLWLLDEVHRSGRSVILLEAGELGSGQTVASQGILHGGLKYTLTGLLSPSAKSVRSMPMIWRRCLAGERLPDLRRTRRRAEFCMLWRSRSLSGKLAMLGARAGLHVTPTAIEIDQRPSVLRSCEGTVARIDEQVIDPASFISDLASQHRERLFSIDAQHGLEFVIGSAGEVQLVRLINPGTGEPLDLKPSVCVLTAGAGNAFLLEQLGRTSPAMQRRPLHMVMARGVLPELNGHCVDGAATRLTITTSTHTAGDTIWQIGGRIAEQGIDLERDALIELAEREVRDVLPDAPMQGVQWSAYRVDRAERSTPGSAKPADVTVDRSDNVIVAWPTKLVLAPRLAELVMAMLPEADVIDRGARDAIQPALQHWPKPMVAQPPWETERTWTSAS